MRPPSSGAPAASASCEWAGSGRGKRGGIRAVYFHHAGPEAIYFLTAYAKADREDLTPADTRALSRLLASIKKEISGR